MLETRKKLVSLSLKVYPTQRTERYSRARIAHRGNATFKKRSLFLFSVENAVYEKLVRKIFYAHSRIKNATARQRGRTFLMKRIKNFLKKIRIYLSTKSLKRFKNANETLKNTWKRFQVT
jgi:hypothetical protein